MIPAAASPRPSVAHPGCTAPDQGNHEGCGWDSGHHRDTGQKSARALAFTDKMTKRDGPVTDRTWKLGLSLCDDDAPSLTLSELLPATTRQHEGSSIRMVPTARRSNRWLNSCF